MEHKQVKSRSRKKKKAIKSISSATPLPIPHILILPTLLGMGRRASLPLWWWWSGNIRCGGLSWDGVVLLYNLLLWWLGCDVAHLVLLLYSIGAKIRVIWVVAVTVQFHAKDNPNDEVEDPYDSPKTCGSSSSCPLGVVRPCEARIKQGTSCGGRPSSGKATQPEEPGDDLKDQVGPHIVGHRSKHRRQDKITIS